MKLSGRKIHKVLFGGNKGVTVFYSGKRAKGIPEKGSFTIGADPFDDLKNAIDKLKPFFIRVCGLNTISMMEGAAILSQKMNEKEVTAFVKAGTKKQGERLRVTGMTLGYDEDGNLKHTKLMGVYANEHGETTAINPPLVHLDRELYEGMELDLKTVELAILEEVAQFESGHYSALEEPEEEEENEEVEASDDEEDEDPDFGTAPSKKTDMSVVKKATKKPRAKAA